MASSYWVDWDDENHPEIRPASSAPEGVTPTSLTMAKVQIVTRARDERTHWLAVIHRTKAMTSAKIDREEESRDA